MFSLAWIWTGIKIIGSFLGGGGINGVLKEVNTYLSKVSDNKTVVAQANIGAEVSVDLAALKAHTEEYQAQIDLAKFRWGWWGERYLLLAAAVPPIIHSGAIYLDSTFKFGWAIAKAPGLYEGQEFKIIATVIGYSVGRAAVAGIVGRFAGGKS